MDLRVFTLNPARRPFGSQGLGQCIIYAISKLREEP